MQSDEDIEARVRATAEATGVPFEIVACDPELADTAAFCAAYGYALEDSANCVVVKGKSEPRRVCRVHGAGDDTRLDVNGVVRRRLGSAQSELRTAADVVEALTGMTIGGVTPRCLRASACGWTNA